MSQNMIALKRQRCFAIRSFITLAENFRKWGAKGGPEISLGAAPWPPLEPPLVTIPVYRSAYHFLDI